MTGMPAAPVETMGHGARSERFRGGHGPARASEPVSVGGVALATQPSPPVRRTIHAGPGSPAAFPRAAAAVVEEPCSPARDGGPPLAGQFRRCPCPVLRPAALPGRARLGSTSCTDTGGA